MNTKGIIRVAGLLQKSGLGCAADSLSGAGGKCGGGAARRSPGHHSTRASARRRESLLCETLRFLCACLRRVPVSRTRTHGMQHGARETAGAPRKIRSPSGRGAEQGGHRVELL